MTFVNEARLHGNGSFTGPLVVQTDLRSWPHSALILQYPSFMKDFALSGLDWIQYRVIELEYIEE
jgi:hypothetical protein